MKGNKSFRLKNPDWISSSFLSSPKLIKLFLPQVENEKKVRGNDYSFFKYLAGSLRAWSPYNFQEVTWGPQKANSMITAASTGMYAMQTTDSCSLASLLPEMSDSWVMEWALPQSATISCFQRISISQQMFLFLPFKRSLYQYDSPSPPKKSRWGGCCKKKKKKGGGEAEAILNTGKCILGICLESQKDTLIILANYIPVRGEYIYIFNIQLIYKNFFDQIDMPFILKSCAKISSLDSLMCEVMNLFSSLLQNAFHFSLQMKTPTLLTSGLPLLNTIFKYKRNHTRTVPLGFCLTFLYIWEGKLMALCLQT